MSYASLHVHGHILKYLFMTAQVYQFLTVSIIHPSTPP